MTGRSGASAMSAIATRSRAIPTSTGRDTAAMIRPRWRRALAPRGIRRSGSSTTTGSICSAMRPAGGSSQSDPQGMIRAADRRWPQILEKLAP